MITLLLSALVGLAIQEPIIIPDDDKGWIKIGETTVDFTRDKDEILVMGSDRFEALKFKVVDAPVEILTLEVHFEKGDLQLIRPEALVKAPGESLSMNLAPGERSIRKVVFVYRSVKGNAGKKAHVELWGLKANKAGEQDKNRIRRQD